ncbi:MAG: ribonuclease HII [Clostridiales bacterium]|nr:ribonuclease HII [Clostridiales bacterium]
MKKLSVAEIKEIIENSEKLDEIYDSLLLDERQSVVKLAAQIKKKIIANELLLEKYARMNHYESLYKNNDAIFIAGIDEAGRGPLAGPVVAAAVILPDNDTILGLDDSKKLTVKKRDELFLIIKEKALAIGIGVVQHEKIDEINILNASKEAMILAVNSLDIKPDVLLIDAVKLDLPIKQENLIKGDQISNSIAAASIIAKVTRDLIMIEMSKKYPQYGFEKHKGYGTKAHYEAIQSFGISKIHRKSFLKNLKGW